MDLLNTRQIHIAEDMDEQSRLAMFIALGHIFGISPKSNFLHGNILLKSPDPDDPYAIPLIELDSDNTPIQITYQYQGVPIQENVILPYVIFKRPSKDPEKPDHFHYHVLNPKPLGDGTYAAAFADKFDISRKDHHIIVKETSRKAVKIYKNTPDPTAAIERDLMNQAYPYKEGSNGLVRGKQKIGLVSHYDGIKSRNILYSKRFQGYSLYDAINHFKFTYPERLLIISNIIQAVILLHQRGVLHRDLKLENIVFDPKTFKVKIIDFGLSNKMSDIKQVAAGSDFIMGPEILSITSYSQKPDLSKLDHYALAAVIAEILNGEPCRDKLEEKARLLKDGLMNARDYALARVVKVPYNFNDLMKSKLIPDKDKPEIKLCLEQLSNLEPDDRSKLDTVLKMFNGIFQPYLEASLNSLDGLIKKAEEPLIKYKGKGKHREKIAVYRAELQAIKEKLAPTKNRGDSKSTLSPADYSAVISKVDKLIESKAFTAAAIQAELGTHQKCCLFSLKAMVFKLKSWWPHILGGSSKSELMSKRAWHNTNSLNCAYEFREKMQELRQKIHTNTLITPKI